MKFFCFLFSLAFQLFASVPTVIDNPQILSIAETKLPHEGLLKQEPDGFLYIQLPKEYIFSLLPLFPDPSICPPDYFGDGKVGAHITVATSAEIKSISSPPIPSLGEKITFSIGHVEKVDLVDGPNGPKVYILTVDSPQIVQIRNKLGLPPKIRDHNFHVTIGVSCPI